MANCPACGAELGQPGAFCPSCGTAIDQGALPTATSPPGQTPAARPPSGSSSDSFDHGRFAPGTLVGDRYRIVGRLGVGGMGEVYRADDLKLGQSVALKFLSEEMERDESRLERFLGEVRTARQVSHPNVCRVYDVGEIDGRRFLSMEYVDGEDLASLLRRIGRLPEDKGIEIARQIAVGLGAMHDRGVLHRDLKPANVMIDGRGRVRLTDFGLATALEQAAREKDFAGTPAYMAPEQLVGEPLTAQTDIYALGLVLYELFTGKRYHQTRRTPESDASATRSDSATSAPVNQAIDQLIQRCLEKDPRRRPASAIAVAAALPGGDPLAAALAAGETPSPQMVADAGEEGALKPKIAVPLLAALVIFVVAFAWVNGRLHYHSYVPFPDSPEVLAARAQDLLERLGYTGPPEDSAYGWTSSGQFTGWVRDSDDSLDRWQRLRVANPPVARFWYRTSPASMTPQDFSSGRLGGGVAVSTDDPALTRPGMTSVRLHPDGRLVSLFVVPPDKELAPMDPAPEPDWALLFEEAGLDYESFTAATPEWLTGADGDTRAAWVGTGAEGTTGDLRVEAAAYRGRPVFFQLVAPWTTPVVSPPGEAGDEEPDDTPVTEVVAIVVLLSLFGAVVATAVVLATRNARLGRADRRGAQRLALATALIVFAGGALNSTIDLGFILTGVMLISWACFIAVLVWTLYTAIEPYVRRRWPQTLISWTRLLDGRGRDPLVGRDLLLGSVLGLAMSTVSNLGVFLYDWRGIPPIPPIFSAGTLSLSGPLATVSGVIWAFQLATLAALGWVVLLVMLRIVLRSERFAMAVFVLVVFGLSAIGTPDPVVDLPFRLFSAVLLVLVITRLGLVALTAVYFTTFAGNLLGISFTMPAFATGALVLGMVAMVAPGVFGFYTSLSGRRAAAAKFLDE